MAWTTMNTIRAPARITQKFSPVSAALRMASTMVNDIQDGMNRYFRGQAFVAFCVGILFSIGFLIIDFPMAIALGLFIGALNMVPYTKSNKGLPTEITVHAILNIIHQIGSESTVFTRKQV